MTLKFEEIPMEYRRVWEEYAKATAHSEFMSDMVKSQKARLANMSDGKTESEKERFALSHEEYKSHLNDTKTARSEALRLKTYLDSLSMLNELYRSKNAMKRAEMNLY